MGFSYIDALHDDLERLQPANENCLIVGFQEGRDMPPPKIAGLGSGYHDYSKYVAGLYHLYGDTFARVAPSIRDAEVRGRFGHVMAGYHALIHYLKSGDWHVEFE